jgi:hypothetical protein
MCGCVHSIEVPIGQSEQEAAQAAAELLDATWRGTGLDDALRPELPVFPAAHSNTWFDDIAACMLEVGIVLNGISGPDARGYTPIFEGQQDIDYTVRLHWYECFAHDPLDPFAGSGSATPAEREYLYDYYQRWVIPCLVMHGYSLKVIPSRDEFMASQSLHWNPYWSLTEYPEHAQYGSLQAQCGPEFGALDRTY